MWVCASRPQIGAWIASASTVARFAGNSSISASASAATRRTVRRMNTRFPLWLKPFFIFIPPDGVAGQTGITHLLQLLYVN